MNTKVSDINSNFEENLQVWARALGTGEIKRKVFLAIYSSRKSRWSIPELEEKTGLTGKAIAIAGRALSVKGLFAQCDGGRVTYEKIDEVHHSKARIIRLADDKKKREALPTKRSRVEPIVGKLNTQIRPKALAISIDSIDDFRKVLSVSRDVPIALDPPRLPEKVFKEALKRIIRERSTMKDWGGEDLDIFSASLKVNGRLCLAGFALKGPGKEGKLSPAKMGMNGDQIDRMLKAPIRLAVVQYEGEVLPSIYSSLEKLSRAKAVETDQNIYYCVLDEVDSYRLRIAYKNEFASALKEYSKSHEPKT